MYYRRKILLALLQELGGKVHKTKMQKLLFLTTRLQEKKAFDFVPYHFGCFSFQANHDLRVMTNYYGFLTEEKNQSSSYWIKKDKTDYLAAIKNTDRQSIKHVVKTYGSLGVDALIKETYVRYPYFAINSTVKQKLLSKVELAKVERQKQTHNTKALFTIGYEGLSLENYLNHLIINGVQILCDVRKNPQSQKYGFTKSQMMHACEGVGIEYRHIPQLGIESAERKELKTLSDYKELFDKYEKGTLKESTGELIDIQKQFETYNRIALTCFEKEECMCHRGKVAKALVELPKWNIPVKHL